MTETVEGASSARLTLDERVEAFEAAGLSGRDSLRAFLPAEADPMYWDVLAELIRVDMERRADAGAVARVADYLGVYPGLPRRPAPYGAALYEEYRLRAEQGEDGLKDEYRRAHGFRVADGEWISAPRAADPASASVMPTDAETAPI